MRVRAYLLSFAACNKTFLLLKLSAEVQVDQLHLTRTHKSAAVVVQLSKQHRPREHRVLKVNTNRARPRDVSAASLNYELQGNSTTTTAAAAAVFTAGDH